MELSQERLSRLKKKLEIMAEAFPDVDVVDLDRLNDLIVYSQVDKFLQQVFLSRIEASDERYLRTLGDVCLEYSFGNLAEALIRYCLENQVIVDIERQKELVDTIVRVVVRFNLSRYVDVEQQSSQIRFFTQAGRFGLGLNRIPVSERLGVLKLLRDSYVEKLLAKSLVDDPDLQALYIAKHNNVSNLIRTVNRSQLEETRWARLYALEDLEYGPNTNRDLFKDLFDDQLPDPVTFDELLWSNFNIMLLPALGKIGLDRRKIIIPNEGRGCIKNPILEIWSEGRLVTKISVAGVVPAHESCIFRLEQENLHELKLLNPNGELTIYLVFSKFGNTPFRLVCSKRVGEVQESLSLDSDEQDIQTLAKKFGVSPERINALAETRVTDNQELFETIQKFMIEIRRSVEQDDGHILLTSPRGDGVKAPRSEAEVQVALKHWLRPMCEALNIDMNREPLTGRGYLDFKFSIGHDLKCLAEVKLFHSTRLDHGLEIQLPTYLMTENTQFGVYVPIIYESSIYESKLTELEAMAHNLGQQQGFKIAVIDIKAWKPDSASKASRLENLARYRL